MNWGKGIVIALTAFIIFITVLVVKMISTSNDLEEVNYYQNEQKYAEEITAKENAARLGNQIIFDYEGDSLVLTRKDGQKLKNVTIELKRPNDGSLDQKILVKNESSVEIDKKTLKKGIYQIKVEYEEKGLKIQQEQEVYI